MVKNFRFSTYKFIRSINRTFVKGCGVDNIVCFVNVFEMCDNNSAKEKAYREIACVVWIINAVGSIYWRYIKLLFS